MGTATLATPALAQAEKLRATASLCCSAAPGAERRAGMCSSGLGRSAAFRKDRRAETEPLHGAEPQAASTSAARWRKAAMRFAGHAMEVTASAGASGGSARWLRRYRLDQQARHLPFPIGPGSIPAMPLGTDHSEEGLLLRDGRALVLRIDGGGEWRLDAPIASERMVGQRVIVEGRRDGFDLLGVRSIRHAGTPGPSAWRRRAIALEALFVLTLVVLAIGTAL